MEQRSVLVIEDEQAIIDILKFNLEKEGYEVYEAMDGITGLSYALEKHPDLILLLHDSNLCFDLRPHSKECRFIQ